MKERLITLLLALGALVLFYILIFPKPRRPPALAGLPVSTDSRPEGYLALWRWLGQEHIPRVSLRYRYDRLPALLPRPRGNVLIVTLPQRVPARTIALPGLLSWVARGNTLLIAAALDDEPLWSLGTDDTTMKRFLELTAGLKFTPAPASTLLHSLTASRLDIRPRGVQPLLSGVDHITAVLALPSRSWRAHLKPGHPSAHPERLPLALAARSDNHRPALWLERLGAGQVIVSAVASPFSNSGMTLPDNSQLVANIIAWSRAPGGAVAFDDAHEGLTAFYDAWAFFADPRLHATLAWIVFLWLAFVLGSQPLRAEQTPWRPLDEGAYIEGSARYLAAVTDPAAIGRRLIEDFLEALRPRGAGSGAHAWQWLGAQPGVSRRDFQALQRLYNRACAGRRFDPTRLQTLLAQLRRNLT